MRILKNLLRGMVAALPLVLLVAIVITVAMVVIKDHYRPTPSPLGRPIPEKVYVQVVENRVWFSGLPTEHIQ